MILTPMPQRRSAQSPPAVTDAPSGFAVGVHVYDLSRGLVSKHAMTLVGVPLEGMLHSSVAAYGFEYYFEGGISRAPRGQTRFGPQYRYVAIGQTAVSQMEFEQWVRLVQGQRYQLWQYRTVEHNCHCFTDEACTYLTGKHCPDFLLQNTEVLVGCPTGKVIAPIARRITGGFQYVIARQVQAHRALLSNVSERERKTLSAIAASRYPPLGVFSYVPQQPAVREAVVLNLLALRRDEDAGGKLTPRDTEAVVRVAKAVGSSASPPPLIAEADVHSALEALALLGTNTPMWAMAPVLSAWRVLVVHPFFTGFSAYDSRLNRLLLHFGVAFHDLPIECAIPYLELLCNSCETPHGGMVIVDRRRLNRFVSVVGLALLHSHSTVRLLGAALASNIVVAVTILSKGSFEGELLRGRSNHSMHRLITVVLFHLGHCTEEAVRHKLLLAVYRLLLLGDPTAEVLMCCSTLPSLQAVSKQCSSTETKQLICMIRSILQDDDAASAPTDAQQRRPSLVDSVDCDALGNPTHPF